MLGDKSDENWIRDKPLDWNQLKFCIHDVSSHTAYPFITMYVLFMMLPWNAKKPITSHKCEELRGFFSFRKTIALGVSKRS